MAVTDVRPDGLTVKIKWSPPLGPTGTRRVLIPRPVFSGGHLVGQWQLPERTLGARNYILQFTRHSNTDFRLSLDIENYWNASVLVPKEPTIPAYETKCTINTAGPEGISGLTHLATKTFVCRGFMPGAHVKADFVSGSSVKIVGGGSWLQLGFFLNNGSQVNLEDSHPRDDEQPFVGLGGTALGTVSPDGVVTVNILSKRTEYCCGDNHRPLASLPGTEIVVTTY